MKMGMKVIVAITLLALLIMGAVSYSYSGPSSGFTVQGFTGASQPSFTLYYADWCPHCKTIKPMFSEFASSGSVSVKGKPVAVRMVSPEKEPEKMGSTQVKGYPTLMYSDSNGDEEYTGPRTVDGFMQFLESKV